MNQQTAVTAILSQWMTQWGALQPTIPYVFDNDFIDDVPQFARLSIQHTHSEQWTLGQPGNRKWLHHGLINVKLYGPGDQGRIELDTLVTTVRQIFQGQRFAGSTSEDGIVCYNSAEREIPAQSNGEYWVITISTAFEFFEVS